jgi:hypothetical protein
MTVDTEHTIDLDRKHRAIRSGNRWAVTRLQPNGAFDLVEHWDGNRRTILQWCQNHGVVPSRDALAQLDRLPEASGFRDRG